MATMGLGRVPMRLEAQLPATELAAPRVPRLVLRGNSAGAQELNSRSSPFAGQCHVAKALRGRAAPQESLATPGSSPRRRQQSVPCAQVASSASTVKESAFFHTLPSGLRLEVLSATPDEQPKEPRPPLVFVHGSYHAAWCWKEHWLPFFAAHGYECYATSILGQGQSDSPDAPVAGTIQSHAADLSHFIRHVIGRPPILIGHSFGGLIVQAYLSASAPASSPPQPYPAPADAGNGWKEPFLPLAGAVLACSVPPSGNKELVMRYLRSKPILSIKVTLSLAAKMFATNVGLCRDSFFSKEMSDDEVKRYQALLAASSKMPLFDLVKLNSSLPVPRPEPAQTPPLLILGAQNDCILDEEALQETATFFFTKGYTVVPGIAHDIMLDCAWERAAKTLQAWTDGIAA